MLVGWQVRRTMFLEMRALGVIERAPQSQAEHAREHLTVGFEASDGHLGWS